MAIWLPCVFLGVMANRVTDVPQIRAKQEARRMLATQGRTMPAEARDELREKSAGDDVILRLLDRYAPLWLAGLLGAGIGGIMASDLRFWRSQRVHGDVFAHYGETAIRECAAKWVHLCRDSALLATSWHCVLRAIFGGDSVCVLGFRRALAALDCGTVLEKEARRELAVTLWVALSVVL